MYTFSNVKMKNILRSKYAGANNKILNANKYATKKE